MSDKKTARGEPVTSDERLQLIGLITLAHHHNQTIRDIESAMTRITQEWDGYEKAVFTVGGGGHTGDVAYGYTGSPVALADDLLRKLGIAPETPSP